MDSFFYFSLIREIYIVYYEEKQQFVVLIIYGTYRESKSNDWVFETSYFFFSFQKGCVQNGK